MAVSKLDSGRRAGSSRSQPLTEDSAATEFGLRQGGRLRYCHSRGCWFRWDGSIWRRDQSGFAFHCLRELARDMSRSEDPRGLLASGKAAFAAGVERFAKADPVFAKTAVDWDKDPMLAGTPSGVLNLRNGLVERADPEDGITRSLAVDPSDAPLCPLWQAFLDQTFSGDASVIRFLQQFLGYSLTGDTSEHAFVFGYGAGGNGKSVLINTVVGILGDYATTAAMDTFTASRADKHPTELAALAGVRFVTASETEEGKAWAESRIKQITGGDEIAARYMRQDFFTFRPAFKLFIAGNYRPDLHNVDEAMRRRLMILPFEHKPIRPDPELETKLEGEWPGILRWMIDGVLDWHGGGLVRPESVLVATKTYFEDQDLVGQWLDDECDVDIGNSHKWELSSALFRRWQAFAERAGEGAGNNKAFAEAMRRRGFEYHRGTNGQRQFRGIQLRPETKRNDGW